MSVTAETAAGLDMLARVCQPLVVDDRDGRSALKIGGIVLLITSVFGCWLMARVDGVPRNIRQSANAALALMIVIAALSVCLLPTLSTAGGRSAAPGVEVAAIGRIGSYDVQVIAGADSDEALDAWFAENNFVMDEPAAQVAADYLADGWSLVAARLARDSAGAQLIPHPLAIEFEVEEPIYPMRLTGLTHKPLALDLFIIAEKRARADNLRCWYAQTCSVSGRRFGSADGRIGHHDQPFADATPRSVVVPGRGRPIGHPAIAQRAWDGCMITRLRGTVDPKDMREDYVIRLTDRAPHRAVVYTRIAAWGTAGAWVMGLLGVMVLVAGAAANVRNEMPAARRLMAFMSIFTVLAVAGASAFVAGRDVVAAERGDRFGLRTRTRPATYRAILDDLEQWYPGPDVTAIETVLQDTYWPTISEGDHPAGFTFGVRGEMALFTLYDAAAIPYAVLIHAETGEILDEDVRGDPWTDDPDAEAGSGTSHEPSASSQ